MNISISVSVSISVCSLEDLALIDGIAHVLEHPSTVPQEKYSHTKVWVS